MIIAGTASLFSQESNIDSRLDALVAAYPHALTKHDGKLLYWRDGTTTVISDATKEKTFAERLRRSSIADQLSLQYPQGPLKNPPAVNEDPGRFRNTGFFEKMYGDCKKGEVSRRLVSIVWLPKTWGKTIQVTSVNQVDQRLKTISAEIDALPEKIKHGAYPTAGTYNCRAVADTGQPSAHSYGIAIDLNLAFSDYWFWRPHDHAIAYRNRMPIEIITIFEKNGFIWGGKWYHFDTMHFEYRPELIDVKNKE